MDFYDDIADIYDDMTRFAERLEKEQAVLKKWLQRYHIKSAVDAACGTGLHAIILSQLGVHTVGVDISEEMLKTAKANAQRTGQAIEWLQASMQEVAAHISTSYDAVFCLGNSIPHLLSESELSDTLQSFYSLLKTGGICVLQLLNYDRILSKRERIVGIHKIGQREFIRFYDFLAEKIRFNILTILWHGGAQTFDLHSTFLYPYKKAEIERALLTCGFKDLQFFGDMQFNAFNVSNSSNLVIVGRR